MLHSVAGGWLRLGLKLKLKLQLRLGLGLFRDVGIMPVLLIDPMLLCLSLNTIIRY